MHCISRRMMPSVIAVSRYALEDNGAVGGINPPTASIDG
jgi:hypothetical protein